MENKTIRQYYEDIFSDWLKTEYEEVLLDPTKYNHKHKYIESPKILARKAVDYFTHARESLEPVTYTGLIISLGLRQRNSLDLYMTYSEDFKSCIQMIKLLIEDSIVKKLYGPDFKAAQFILKTNYKTDYTETIHQVVENRDFTIGVKDPNKE